MTNFTQAQLNRINKTLLYDNEGKPSERDSYYVYMLSVRDKNEQTIPFYIGKGKNSRIFAHESDAKSVINAIKDNDKQILEKAVCDKIRKIIKELEIGQKIENHIIKWGLTEYEAFMCESALINMHKCCYPYKLTNIANGHASTKEKNSKIGKTKAYEISDFLENVCIEEIFYEDSLLTSIPVMFIKIEKAMEQYETDQAKENQEIDYKEYVYESTQGYWDCNIDRARRAKYAIAMQNSVIIGIYRIDKWMTAKELNNRKDAPQYPVSLRNNDKKKIKMNTKPFRRFGFIQKILENDTEINELKTQLLNKIIKEKNPKKTKKGKEKSWFKEQKSRYNYDITGRETRIRKNLRNE